MIPIPYALALGVACAIIVGFIVAIICMGDEP